MGDRHKIGLYLGAKPTAGGTFQYNQTVLEAVSVLQDSYDVVIGYSDDCWLPYLQEYGLKTVLVPLGFWSRVLGSLWKKLRLSAFIWRKINPYFHPVARALIREDCNLWIYPSQDQWSWEVDVPALATIHDLMHRYEGHFPEVSASGEFRRREIQYSNMCRFAKGILVDAEVGSKQLQESYGMVEERIHILPTIAPKYMYSTKPIEGFDDRYKLPEKFIFYPAQFWEHKNHGRLVRVIKSLKERIPDLKLVLVGSKKNGYASTVKLIEELGLSKDIVILGYVPDEDMVELYRRSRGLVFPTFFGPTNIPPLEAFIVGCPVACSGIYGMPEQVGDAALLFNPTSEEEIAEAIFKLWTDDELCKELSIKGMDRSSKWGQPHFNERLREIVLKTLESK